MANGNRMQIAFHIGANCTDGERLIKSLLKNTDAFAEQGIKVPGPSKYRKLLRETIKSLQGQVPAPDTQDVLLDAIMDDERASRLVLSQSNFLTVPARLFEGGVFYATAPLKILSLRALFPKAEFEFHLGLRNPATLVPAIFAQVTGKSAEDFMSGVDPLSLRWSDVIRRLQQAAPDVPITVWCNEDTPLIWAQLIREISGVDPLTKISGGFDLLSAIMSEEGMKRFLSYLRSHPPQTEIQKRRIIAAFLDKYALEDEIEEEVDMPGWDEALVDRMTELYEEDIYGIERMPGVTFIAP